MEHSRSTSRSAFSLVEVVIALGILAFCLVPLIGLLPAGFQTFRDANDEAAAANIFKELSLAIRNATSPHGSGDFAASGRFAAIEWSEGSGAAVTTLAFGQNGKLASASEARFILKLEITPPASRYASGRAFISIAWPVTAQWNAAERKWNSAHGSFVNGIVFLPKP